MKWMIRKWFFIMCALVFAMVAGQGLAENLQDPELIACYTFDNITNCSVPDISSNQCHLFSDEITVVAGRARDKRAVHIEHAPYYINPEHNFNMSTNGFSFECWIKRYDNGQRFGMIANVGSGYYSGWRVVSISPNGPFQFQIGQPKGAFSVPSKSCPDGSWHHLAATYDGKYCATFLDGALSTQKLFTGTVCFAESTMIIGKAAWGVGQACFDLDELAIYRRALSPDEIALHYKSGVNSNTLSAAEADNMFAVGIPQDSYGYFPSPSLIPLAINATNSAGPYDARISVMDLSDNILFDNRLILQDSSNGIISSSTEISCPAQCGIYWIQVLISQRSGRLIKAIEIPFASIVKLPPIAGVSSNSPLGFQTFTSMPEARFYGNKWDRLWMGVAEWPNIEREKGKYDWTKIDQVVNENKAHGTEILYTIHGLPRWAVAQSNLYKWKAWSSIILPEDINDYCNFVRALVARYKDSVHYWEILNEPNGCDPDDYVKLLKNSYQTIKAVDPSAQVVGIDGCPGFVEWTEKVLKAGGGPYFDILSFHNYNYNDPNLWAKKQLIEKLNALSIKYLSNSVPLWNTESAFHMPFRVNRRPMTEEYFRSVYGSHMPGGKDWYAVCAVAMAPEHRSACWEVQATLLELAAGMQKRFVHAGMGLSKARVTEKGVALAALSTILNDQYRSTRRLDVGSDLANGVCIEHGSNTLTGAIWSMTTNATLVYLDVKQTNTFYGMDYLGNRIAYDQPHNGILKISVSQEPRYIANLPPGTKGIRLIDSSAAGCILEPTFSRVYSGSITVTNPFNARLEGCITTHQPASWHCALNPDIQLEANRAMRIPFELSCPSNTPQGDYPCAFLLETNHTNVCEYDFMVQVKDTYPIFHKDASGKYSPSSGHEHDAGYRANTLEQVVVGKPNLMFPEEFPHWSGTNDLSYSVVPSWTDDGLMLAIHVTDDIICAPSPENMQSAYKYDCVEIFLSCDNMSNMIDQNSILTRNDTYLQYFVMPPASSVDTNCVFILTNGKLKALAEMRVTGHRTAGGYDIQAHLSSQMFTNNALLRLNVAVDDMDQLNVKRKTQMFLFGKSDDTWCNPRAWGRFVLKP